MVLAAKHLVALEMVACPVRVEVVVVAIAAAMAQELFRRAAIKEKLGQFIVGIFHCDVL